MVKDYGLPAKFKCDIGLSIKYKDDSGNDCPAIVTKVHDNDTVDLIYYSAAGTPQWHRGSSVKRGGDNKTWTNVHATPI